MVKQRTTQQNRALHLYLTQLANELNNHGITMKMFIDHLKGWDIPITKEFLHEIWKMKQEKMGMGNSTTQLTSEQVTQVYDAINNFTSTEFGVGDAFPSIEALIHTYEDSVR